MNQSKAKATFLRHTWLKLALTAVALFPAIDGHSEPIPTLGGPAKVKIRKMDGAYKLFVNREPFYIKGAGLGGGSQEKLAAHGGNSFRTWRSGNGSQVLDRALKNHLFVAMGLDLATERHGFNYDDPAAVARQFEAMKAQVLKYKDHPALLCWIIGNELNLNGHNPSVWNAVNDLSKWIHQVDPNHPTVTALAGIPKDVVKEIKTRAPDLDMLAFQMYGDIVNLPRHLKEADWSGPYIVTEWGATGHWEVQKTPWGAPIENDSSIKADAYLSRYQKAIAADAKQCLGSYVFLWGQKQERTPTWYGMFLASGEETETVDVLHYLWNGKWPANRSPRIQATLLDGKAATQDIHVKSGATCIAKVTATDSDHDTLTYRWEIMQESTDLGTGGDYESTPKTLTGLIRDPKQSEIELNTPSEPGAYRLFVYVFDGKGHAAHANIPFYVDAATTAATR